MKIVSIKYPDGKHKVQLENFVGRVFAEKIFATEGNALKAIALIQATLRQHVCPQATVITRNHSLLDD